MISELYLQKGRVEVREDMVSREAIARWICNDGKGLKGFYKGVYLGCINLRGQVVWLTV